MSFDEIAVVPSRAVNGYLWDTMKELNPELEEIYGETIPFYPVGDSAAGDSPWDNKPYFIYDRVFRFNSKPFHEHKRESTLYYLKADELDTLEWSSIVQIILDREDDVAQDINNWIRAQEGGSEEYPVYFHNLRVYQSRSSSTNSRDVSTVEKYYISEFMIDTHYHITKQLMRVKREEDLGKHPEGNLTTDGKPVKINGLTQYDQIYETYKPPSENGH
jgi:hypothetical protein